MAGIKNIIIAAMLLCFTSGYCQNWVSTIDEAKALAQKENKNILLVFTGSDWCAPCIKLDKNVWATNAFKQEATANWILLKADFPKKKANALPEEQQKQNAALSDKYNKEDNFPLVVVMDANGKTLGKTGYKNVTPAEYIALLHSLEKK